MSDNVAKSHKNISNRAKPHGSIERKVVYKSVLDNPFYIPWPSVPMNLQNAILAQVVSMVDSVSQYHLTRFERAHRKRKAARIVEGREKQKRKLMVSSSSQITEVETSRDEMGNHGSSSVPDQEMDHSMTVDDQSSIAPPAILQHITIGINEVTKKLESFVRSFRRTVVASDNEDNGAALQKRSPIKCIFVCRADIDPQTLVAHLPQLVAACNSVAASSDSSEMPCSSIKIVPLPKGAELSLAEAMGLRRVSVLAVDDALPDSLQLDALLSSVPVLNPSWLRPSADIAGHASRLEPTHIKQLRTNAPKDMKAAKEQRARGRAAAKARTRMLKEATKRISITTDNMSF